MLAFLAGLLTNLYSQDTVTPVAYIAPGSVYTQQFDGLPYSGSFTLTGKGPFNLAGSPINGPELTGWQLLMIGGSGKNAVFAASTGSSTGNGVYSYGNTGSPDRSLGSLASGAGIYAVGMILTNQTGVTLDSLAISFTAKQWRKGGSAKVNTWTFRYKTGHFTNIDQAELADHPPLNFSSVITSPGATALNGNLPEHQQQVSGHLTGINWENGASLLLRWDDANEPGNNDGMAIDQFSFSASGAGLGKTPPPISQPNNPIDANKPFITALTLPGNKLYKANDTLDFLVHFNENILVDTIMGTPSLSITIGSRRKTAFYVGSSASHSLLFRYIIQPGETAANGIRLNSPLALNDAGITDIAGNPAILVIKTAGILKDIRIDAVTPSVSNVTGPAPGIYKNGSRLDFIVNYNKVLLVDTTNGKPSLVLSVDKTAKQVVYIGGSGTMSLQFQYTVLPDDLAKKGIALHAMLSLNGSILTDTAGNDAALVLKNTSALSQVKIDGVAPLFVKDSVTGLAVCQDAKQVSLNDLLQVSDKETGETLTWRIAASPVHGSLNGFTITRTSNGHIVTPSGLSYTPSPGFYGDDPFLIQISDGVNTSVITIHITVIQAINHNQIDSPQLVCMGGKPAMLLGTLPSGGTNSYAYRWESSVVNADNGFVIAGGNHALQDYAPESASVTTWFRRIVSSGACADTSQALSVTVATNGIWLGNTNEDWQTGSNWCGGHVPVASTDVVIAAGTPHLPQIHETGVCNRLSILKGTNLTVTGLLQIKGSILADSSIDATNGSLEFNGTASQLIPAAAFAGGTVRNLCLNNKSSVTLDNRLALTGILTINRGKFITNNYLTLKSNARIGPSAVGSIITGNICIAHQIPGGKNISHLSGHPFATGIGLAALTTAIANAPVVFHYDEEASYLSFDHPNAWIPFTHTNNTGINDWERHQGIRLMARSSTPTILQLSGPVNQGDQEINFPGRPYTGYRLAGNPYPCPIDPSLATKSSGIGNYYWIWDAQQGTNGGYTSIPFKSRAMVPAFAAFFVKTNAWVSNSLLFTENCKLVNKLTASQQGMIEDNYHLELRLENDSIFWDRILLFHIDSARDSRDKMDAEKLMNPDVNLYSFSADKHLLSADARPMHEHTIIPLGIHANLHGAFSIRVASMRLPKQIKLFLHDKYLGRWQSLEKDSSYYFSVTTDTASQGNHRFEIRGSKKEPATIIHIPAKITLTAGPVPATDRIAVGFTATEPGNTVLTISGINGIVMKSFNLGFQKEGTCTIPVADLPGGIYLIEVRCGNQVAVQKIIKS